MESGVDSFGAVISDRATAITVSPVQRMENLLAEAMLADPVGPDVFGIVEQHRSEFVDSAPAIILGAAATRTKNIRLTSAVTVSAADLFSCEILKVVPGRLLPKLSPPVSNVGGKKA